MATDLDKFKRRVIRSVARVMWQDGQDLQADKKMWADLQKEVGCDCKLLWERMRTLTLKKMKRLLPADDRLCAIAEVAQMQLTDWLLFDLVLVHEDVDVISEDPESKCMKELVNLVQTFEIEGKKGDALTTAWTAATFFYNSFGRQCSPMLLQRRWYQLKKTTRAKFYSFWFEYRGNSRLLEMVKPNMPNALHSLVAKTFPYVITRPFKEWHELIEEKFVILPEEFEAKMRIKNAPKSDKNEPDLVLLEPQIETIDLGVDSDTEKDKDTPETSQKKIDSEITKSAVKIKQEIEDYVEENSEIPSELIEMDEIVIESNDRNDVLVNEINRETEAVDLDEIRQMEQEVEPIDDNEAISEADTNSKSIENDESNSKINAKTTVDIVPIEIDDDTDDNVVVNETEDTVEVVKHEVQEVNNDVNDLGNDVEEINDTAIETDTDVDVGVVQEETMLPQILNVFGNVNVGAEVLASLPLPKRSSVNEPPTTVDETVDADENLDEIIRRKTVEYTTDIVKEEHPIPNIEDNQITDEKSPEQDVDIPISPKFETQDENLQKDTLGNENLPNVPNASNFNHPYVDITADFMDDGIELIDDGIEYNDYDDELPVKPQQVKIERSPSYESEAPSPDPQKFDLKLLMQPVVYSVKLDDMNVFKNTDIDCVRSITLIDKALIESKPVFTEVKTKKDEDNQSSTNDENPKSDTSDSDDEDYVPEAKRVKVSSYLLQKPRSRSYNPIQLCKNPDFNTRLKRLTFGFLSSPRNRTFLKLLKPMTIDLSKTFEDKLIDGTLYLKSSDNLPLRREEAYQETSEQAIAVLPSAMPVQTLIDNSPLNLGEILKPTIDTVSKPKDVKLTERQKTINLPDIDHIRRINQKLLTAEVTPMRIGPTNEHFKPPVQLVSPQNSENVKVKSENESNCSFDIDINKPNDVRKPGALSSIAYKDILQKDKVIDEVTASGIKEKQSIDNNATQDLAGTSFAASRKDATNINQTKKPGPASFFNRLRVKPPVRKQSRLPWNKPQTMNNPVEDCLLTIDTLQKMLSIVSYKSADLDKLKPKQVKKLLEKGKFDLEKRLLQYEDSLKNDGTVPNVDKVEEPKDITVNVEEDTSKAKKDEPKPSKKVPKVKVIRNKPYGEYCCWARIKLWSPRIANTKIHQCPRLCRCCCRDELAAKMLKSNQWKQKQAEIVISDDEDTKKISDTIENVIKQSKEVVQPAFQKNNLLQTTAISSAMPVAENEKEKTEVSIQCDMDIPEHVNEAVLKETSSALNSILNVKTKTPPKQKPGVRIVKRSSILPKYNSKPDVVTVDDENPELSKSQFGQRLGQYNQKNAPKNMLPSRETDIQKVRGRIIIDGTKKLTVESTSTATYFQTTGSNTKKKLIYLSNHASQPVRSPLYLGKDKILLTDIKFPNENASPISNSPVKTTEAVLPPGVQLVLLPNGVVTYTVAPDVELDEAQKATIPPIIAAVQEQLFAAGTLPLSNVGDPITTPNTSVQENDLNKTTTESTDLIDITQDSSNESAPKVLEDAPNTNVSIPESVENTESQNLEIINQESCNDAEKGVSKQQDKSIENNVNELENKSSDVDSVSEVVKEDSTNQPNSIPPNNDTEHSNVSEKEKEVIFHPNNEPSQDADVSKVTKNAAVTNIVYEADSSPIVVSEDNSQDVIALPEKENPVEEKAESSKGTENTNRKSLLSDLMEMSGIWDDIDANAPTADENTVAAAGAPEVLTEAIQSIVPPLIAPYPPVPPLVPLAPPAEDDGLTELTPITSFNQLKYACDRNAKFFKLDLKTGVLSTISVCIKKQPSSVIPESVIDLTEEEDVIEINHEPPKDEVPRQYHMLNKLRRSLLKVSETLNKEQDSVKPLKLFRSVRILKRNKEHTVILPAETPMTQQGRRRKQSLIKVREETNSTVAVTGKNKTLEVTNEDSLDSSSLDQYIYRDSDFLYSSENESSDDEPLAVKAKRMRVGGASCNKDNTNNDKGNETVNLPQDATSTTAEEQNNLNEKLAEQEKQDETSENMSQEDIDEADYEVEALDPDLEDNLMEFLPDNMEEDGEDCILGV